jgi:hypothetical protein
MNKLPLYLILLSLAASTYAQREIIPFNMAYKRVYNISRANGAPVIDGKLDEEFWSEQGLWSEPFVQVSPYEREPSPSVTRAKILYDDTYIYVGIHCRDAVPERMNRFVNNRDANAVGDLVSVAFDTYHDYRAAPEFNLNLGGNRTDLIVTDQLAVNLSWNAVWTSATHASINDSCWTAELRIPFSQLRYNWRDSSGVWGLHIRRIIRRNNEVQNWSMIPLKNNGHVFSFGEMHGMNLLPRPRSVELLPYSMLRSLNSPKIQGSPYNRGAAPKINAGLDAKFGLADFTLDLTVNPDFGQVELDPSVMNLTAYETFYDEKRPFFLEGKHIFDFAAGSDMMFYSRRTGSAPSIKPIGIDNTTSYAEEKDNVPIIGALKLTGTNRSGLTIGILQSLTARVSAKVTRDGVESTERLDAPASYTVIRIQKNRGGNTLLGGMITSVNRLLSNEPNLAQLLPSSAHVAGVDFVQYFGNRLYYIDAKAMLSAIGGSASAIARLQANPAHYYQRESARGYMNLNPERTSLAGTGGYVKAGRRGNARWTFAQSFEWASPGFDLNDAGYLKQADFRANTSTVEFRQTNVWRWFRSNRFTLSQRNVWDYGGTAANNFASLEWRSMFINRYEIVATTSYGWNQLDSRLLRGGPDVRYNPYATVDASFNTDKAGRVIFSLGISSREHSQGARSYRTITPGLDFRIGNHVLLAGQFGYSTNDDKTQYVATSRPLYFMARMKQQTYNATLKLQTNLTPDVSIQFYASPFISTASFSEFKVATDTKASKYADRFDPLETSYNNSANTYSTKFGPLPNPNFRFNEFRSNIVARWEYMPGSTIYLVWEHRRSQRDGIYSAQLGDNISRMANLPAINTLMIKLNYWFDI